MSATPTNAHKYLAIRRSNTNFSQASDRSNKSASKKKLTFSNSMNITDGFANRKSSSKGFKSALKGDSSDQTPSSMSRNSKRKPMKRLGSEKSLSLRQLD